MNTNYSLTLFSQIVSLLENLVEKPYLKSRDIGSFEELADVLNHKGLRNRWGKELTGKSLTKLVSRIPYEIKMDFMPDFMDETNFLTKWNNTIRRRKGVLTDGEKMGERYV